MNTTPRATVRASGGDLQKVVVVNGTPTILEMLEAVLDAGRYDMVFVESSAHAYSRVKRVQPNLIVLCMNIEDVDGFQLLSMLKLDAETRGIPVVTYATDGDDQTSEDSEGDDEAMQDFRLARVGLTMN